MAAKFDLFTSLSQLSKRDLQWFEKQDDDTKKSAAPFVMMRWMTGTNDAAQIMRINSFTNPYAFSLGQEKSLLFKLLAASASGNSTRYTWLKGPSAKSDKLKLQAVKQYFNCSLREAETYNVDDASAIEMAAELGWDEDEIKKLKNEVLKNGQGNTETASARTKKR
jgi:hypothetical protein